jgi:hypothetical protein
MLLELHPPRGNRLRAGASRPEPALGRNPAHALQHAPAATPPCAARHRLGAVHDTDRKSQSTDLVICSTSAPFSGALGLGCSEVRIVARRRVAHEVQAMPRSSYSRSSFAAPVCTLSPFAFHGRQDAREEINGRGEPARAVGMSGSATPPCNLQHARSADVRTFRNPCRRCEGIDAVTGHTRQQSRKVLRELK